MIQIGIHLGREAPLDQARERGADCVQFFVSDPQGWRVPPPGPDAADLATSPMGKYVHAPYGINVASGNNRIRIPSRKLLAETCRAAAAVGATAVIVHGGHVTADDEEEQGFIRWRKALEQLESPVLLLLENTAGGNHAMARRLDTIARLWEHVGDLGLGFCLDTCHAHAGGEGLDSIVERVGAVTGRIDLVHANDSKDPAGSGRDRHQNLGHGEIGIEAIAAVVEAAGAPVICETPGGVAEHRADIDVLRSRLARVG
ncbi:MAG TPA: deoxyribonuclease IV [Actinomycetes bacterium]|jgi:deoxyribonuclease-4|nr:deoxyribonuclease IV [Actinomycetes bacterium]